MNIPVIRGTPTATVLTAERRSALVEQLAYELSGKRVPNGPVIFEIPLKESGRIDVLVVWEALRQAMLEEGAINISQGKVDLRFPTMAMAEAAH